MQVLLTTGQTVKGVRSKDCDWSPELVKRFWSKVLVTELRECWNWQAYKTPRGYGQFSPTHDKPERANRFCWTICCGPIPAGYYVLHSCDNPSCVNPAHLFLGTPQDNMDDMRRKGRARPRHGESHPCAKLSSADVHFIRTAPRYWGFVRDVCKRFGVKKGCIGRITKGTRRKNG